MVRGCLVILINKELKFTVIAAQQCFDNN